MNKYLCFIMATLFIAASCEKSTEKRISQLLHNMTLEQKLTMIGGYNSFYIRGFADLKIPEIRMADGPVGVRNLGPSTSYPASICLAASFDKELAQKVGKAIGSEARSKNVHVMLAPAMNIHRAPFCGRNFEYLGEDPYLAGQIAAFYTTGIQGEGVIATAKHFVANNQDYNRHHVSSDMDERTLHEIYLPAFKTTVQQGKVAAVMTSYNLVNGIHASQHNYLINEILKSEWGFDGIVMSDWVSTYDGLACAKNGLDLEMPSGKMMHPDTLLKAIKQGILDESIIDEKIKRILRIYDRFGFLDNPDIASNYKYDSLLPAQVALEAARGGIVLLKNEKSFLPLQQDNIKKIAVLGPNAHPAVTGGGGSSFVKPVKSLSIYEAIWQIAGKNIEVNYERGIYEEDKTPEGFFDTFDFYIHENGQKVQGVAAEYYNNKKLKGEIIYSTTYKALNLEKEMMKSDKIPEEDFSARFTCYFSPEESGEYTLGVAGDDGYRLFVNGQLKIEQWKTQPEKFLSYQQYFKTGKEYKIEVEYFQGNGGAAIRLSAHKKDKQFSGPRDYLQRALNLAKSSDVVIVCAGFTNNSEGEGFDRTFEMPLKQSEFIKQIQEVNPNTVVILNAGGNIDMKLWIDHVKALIHTWYPGQSGSLAVAEILFGLTNPSGKLPVSFERNLVDNPTFANYFDEDNDLHVYYKEGIFLGYRYYDQAATKPLFSFGFGLSYTRFEYSPLKVNKEIFQNNDRIIVSVDITNTGEMDGAEVVQLYIQDMESSLPRPVKELKGFAKVFLKKGETKTAEITLDQNAFSFYHPSQKKWIAEPGNFKILLGSSSVDIREEAVVTLQ